MFAFLYLVKKKLFFEEIQKLEVFSKNGALKNFTKLAVKHLRQSLIFNKVAGYSSTGVSCDFCEFLRTTISADHIRTTASGDFLFAFIFVFKHCFLNTLVDFDDTFPLFTKFLLIHFEIKL